jgi:hypothetical protein
MSKSIWKFPMPLDGATVEMNAGAEVLHVALQHGQLCLWALTDTEGPQERRRFITYGTGHPVPSDLRLSHVGTVLTDGGRFVWHIFEVLDDDAQD